MADLLISKPEKQSYSASTVASVYPYHRYAATVSVGQGKQQKYGVQVSRQIVVEEPNDSVVSINCPPGPVT